MSPRADDDSAGGLVLLDDDELPRAADRTALAALGFDSVRALRASWPGGVAARAGLRPCTLEEHSGRPIRAVRVLPAEAGAEPGTASRTDAGADALRALARPVHHDLRGPLNAAALHLDLLDAALEAGAEPPPAAARVVRRQLARVDALLRGWFAVAAPAPAPVQAPATEAEGALADFDALALARDARRVVQPLARKRRVRISTVRIERATPDARAARRAHGDRAALGRDLVAALLAAVRAAGPGATVRLSLALDADRGSPAWRVAPADAAPEGWRREADGSACRVLPPARSRGIG